jgi:two-component system sensor histidine kinase QseC
LQVALLVGISLIVLVSYIAIYSYVSDALRRQYDTDLTRKVHAFALMGELEQEPEDELDEEYDDFGDDPDNVIRFEFAEIPIPEYQAYPKAEYYQVWDESGQVLARSPSLKGGNLPRVEMKEEGVSLENILLPDSRRGRIATVFLVPKLEGDVEAKERTSTRLILSLARSTEELDETLAVLRVGALVVGIATIALATVLIWVSVRRGLRPLDELSSEIESLSSEELDHRFNTEKKPLELMPICRRLDGLLDRLGSAFARERRFTSDVAHELRTPIAELRALAEVSLNREHLSEADRRSFRDARDIAQHMERVASALLEIARCASGQVAIDRKRSDLGKLVRTAWLPFEEEARAKTLDVQMNLDACPEIETDPALLETMLTNLFSNAVTYTPAGGRIRLELEVNGDTVCLTLANSTDDLTPDDLTHLCDTFWRKQKTDADSTHLGIGLSVVAAFARVLGIEVESSMPSEGLFQLALYHPI